MAFFEDLGKKISETSSGVVKKTKDTAEVMKLSATLTEEEKALANAYSYLGEAYLNAHPEDYDEKLANFVEQVKVSKEKIEKYKAEIYRLKGFIPCENCGNMVPADTVFCTSCGTRMQPVEEPVAQPVVNANACKNCGNPLKEGALFCTACGTKVEQTVQAEVEPEVEEETAVAVEETVAEEVVVSEETVEEAAQENVDLCKNCGAVLKGGALFCTSCGTKIEARADNTFNTENAGFVIKNICQNCGKELPMGAKFCTACGTAVE